MIGLYNLDHELKQRQKTKIKAMVAWLSVRGVR